MPAVLPCITDVPQHHPDCCVAICNPLIHALASCLPRTPELVLSIGGGTGLLEALLLDHDCNVNLQSVEVNNTTNKYLPESSVVVVAGTWAMFAAASEASTWLFVYPRDASLVSLYIQRHMSPLLVKIIWIGPREDWADYEGIFRSIGPVTPLDAPLAPYEVGMLIRVDQ